MVEIINKQTQEEKESAALGLVTDRFNYSHGYWTTLHDHNRRLMRDYRMELKLKRDETTDETKWRYRSKVFPPIAYEKAEVVTSNVIDAVFAKHPFYSVGRGRGKMDEGDMDKTSALLDYQLRERNFRGKMDEALQESVLLGTKIVRLRWVYESEWFTKRRTIYNLGIPIGVVEEKVLEETYEGPDIDLIPFYNFYIDPATPPGKLQMADYVMLEAIKPWWEFKADAELLEYKNVDEVEKLCGKWITQQTTADERSIPQDNYAKMIKIVHYYDHDRIIDVAVSSSHSRGGAVVLRDKELHEVHENGKHPFYGLQTHTAVDEGVSIGADETNEYHPGSYFPTGLLHVTHGLQQVITTMINQRIDTVTSGMQPSFFISGADLEDEGEYEMGFEPASMVHLASDLGLPVGDIVRQIEVRDFYGQGYGHLLETFLDMMDNSSGATAIIAGQFDSSNATATGTLQLTSNAVRRFTRLINTLVRNGLEPLLTNWIDLNARMIDANTVAYVTGNKHAIYVNPEDIVRGASVNIRVAPFYSKRLQQDNLLRLAPILMQMNPFINLKALTEAILRNDEFIEEPSLLLPDEIPDFTPLDMQDLQAMRALDQQMKQNMLLGKQGQQPNSKSQPTSPLQGARGVAGSSLGNVPNFDSAAEVNSFQSFMAGNRS